MKANIQAGVKLGERPVTSDSTLHRSTSLVSCIEAVSSVSDNVNTSTSCPSFMNIHDDGKATGSNLSLHSISSFNASYLETRPINPSDSISAQDLFECLPVKVITIKPLTVPYTNTIASLTMPSIDTLPIHQVPLDSSNIVNAADSVDRTWNTTLNFIARNAIYTINSVFAVKASINRENIVAVASNLSDKITNATIELENHAIQRALRVYATAQQTKAMLMWFTKQENAYSFSKSTAIQAVKGVVTARDNALIATDRTIKDMHCIVRDAIVNRPRSVVEAQQQVGSLLARTSYRICRPIPLAAMVFVQGLITYALMNLLNFRIACGIYSRLLFGAHEPRLSLLDELVIGAVETGEIFVDEWNRCASSPERQ